jgi:drug/metabolite transporter (DMT)-like permease
MRGAAAMVTSMGLFMAGDTVMKFALQAGTPLFQMNAIRGVVSALLCLLLVLAMGEARNLRHVANPWAVGRGLCETVANFGFTIAMTQIPLADVTAIVQTCPLFVLLGAWLIWGERLGPVHLLLIGVGLTGPDRLPGRRRRCGPRHSHPPCAGPPARSRGGTQRDRGDHAGFSADLGSNRNPCHAR